MNATALQPALSMNPAEVEKFSAIAGEWWDETGKFGVLHKFNPVRIAFIKQQAAKHFNLDASAIAPLAGLEILDIGCGGGLLAEPLARLGARVTAIDPSEKNIKTAMVHADEQNLDINYRATTAEQLAGDGETFDIVMNMEVIEHVTNPQAFTQTCALLVKPGGQMFMATMNRTLKAFGLAIIGAEYILGWMPKGTHHWEKFIKPQEYKDWLSQNDMTQTTLTGVTYNPLSGTWSRSNDTAVNYMVVATKAK